MNKCIMTGRLTTDPVLRNLGSKGTSNVKITLACDRPGKDAGADYIPLCIWGGSADFVAKYATKGTLIAVSGSWHSGSYEKDGVRVYTHELSVDSVEILEKRKGTGTTNAEPAPEEVILEGNDTLPY